MVAAVMAGAAIGGSILSSNAQSNAAEDASNAQGAASSADIAERRRQFDSIRQLLAPYTEPGAQAFGAQGDLIGLGGEQAQQQAISGIEGSPQFASLIQQGEDALLQNASATGGLRGGNTQAALAQFRPQMLSALIDQQFSRLGGMASVGQNAAAGVGNAGMQTSAGVSNAINQMGASQAGNALAQGRAQAGVYNGISQGLGTYYGMGGTFGGSSSPSNRAIEQMIGLP